MTMKAQVYSDHPYIVRLFSSDGMDKLCDMDVGWDQANKRASTKDADKQMRRLRIVRRTKWKWYPNAKFSEAKVRFK